MHSIREHTEQDNKTAIIKKYRFIIILQSVFIFAVLAWGMYWLYVSFSDDMVPAKQMVPRYRPVMEIINPLKYSFIPVLKEERVYVSVDFKKKQWILNNTYQFDRDGNIILPQGLYGTCVSLVIYTYNKIKNMFSDSMNIEAAHVAESGFCPNIGGYHYVLLLTEKRFMKDRVYMLDPSFKRYGLIDEFDEYQVIEKVPIPAFIGKDMLSNTLGLNHNIHALIIRDKILLSFGMMGVGEIFDKDNYLMFISARRKYGYSPKIIYVIQKDKRVVSTWESPIFFQKVMKTMEYRELRDIVKRLFEHIKEI